MRLLHSQLLRYLDEVARAGSIRKASAKLNIASSSINRQILALEAELGSPIFHRLHRSLRLTPAGEILVDHVRRTLKDLGHAVGQIEDLRGIRRGTVTVALVGGLASTLIIRVCSKFRERYPMVKLVFRRYDGDKIATAVTSGECDLGLSFLLPDDPNLTVVAAIDCYVGAIVPTDHPLAKRASVRISDCVGQPMILPDETMMVRGIINAGFERLNTKLYPEMESNSIEMIRGFVASGQGISFLNQINVNDERAQGLLVFLPIVDRLRPLNLRIVRRAKDQQLIPGLLANAIKAAVEELEPGSGSQGTDRLYSEPRDS
ncbi:LysR family transcriptional regulator [Sphingomonas bacterium]|uniref:LysR family transcriptional regulator n=1 Tax=Sphingomonas bacterium TaxID=1895847 RepID=UPI001576BF91|nr:LysR family transcriptional regulator [Sphingomonas bacterium]